MPYGFEDMLEDLDIPESLGFLAGQSQNTTEEEDPYALPKDGSMDWESLPNGTQLGKDDKTSSRETSSLDSGNYQYSGAGSENSGGGLISTFKDGLGAVSGFIKDNKELSQMIGGGIAGAFADKNKKEIAQAQIDYLKEKQDALNKSVTAYGKTYKKA